MNVLASSSFGSISAYVIVIALGAFVGIAELTSRYRDAPLHALRTVPAGFYVGLNAAASAAALALIQAFGWTFGQTGDAERYVQILVAGTAAIAFFRTSLFIVRVGDTDVGVGPASFLQVLLAAADRDVDRIRARARALSVSDVMVGISFSKAYVALPAYCLALMQNVSADDQSDLGRDVDALRGANMDERAKVLNLGLALMNVVGTTGLKAAVASLRPMIHEDPPGADNSGAPEAALAAPKPPEAGELPPIAPAPSTQADEPGPKPRTKPKPKPD